MAITISMDAYQIGGNTVYRKGHVSGRLCLLLAATLLTGSLLLATMEQSAEGSPGSAEQERRLPTEAKEKGIIGNS